MPGRKKEGRNERGVQLVRDGEWREGKKGEHPPEISYMRGCLVVKKEGRKRDEKGGGS